MRAASLLALVSLAAAATHQVPNTLVNPNALTGTKNLFSKLLSKYGSGQILSGQEGPAGVAWLEKNLGTTPAILGVDFIDYSPTRVQYGAKSTAVEDAIAFNARGGIVSVQWHFNAPRDLINSDEIPWYDGIYSYGSTFNLTSTLDQFLSSHYTKLVTDIDAIAVELLRLQAANVSVLWRPLPEAESGRFWWGAFGPQSSVRLYKLIYDRFTNYFHLNNLIWVWDSVGPAWYPGSDVVDILAYNSFPDAGDHGPVAAPYSQLVSLGGDRKLVGLAQVGSIPDPAVLRSSKVDWSYFVAADGEYIESDTYNTLEFKKRVYSDPAVLKLADVASWKKA